MTKYDNPFFTLHEASAILGSVGLKTNGEWAQCILGVEVNKVYSQKGDHFRIAIQVTQRGMSLATKIADIDTVVTKCKHTTDFDKLSLVPSDLLEIFTLIPAEKEGDPVAPMAL